MFYDWLTIEQDHGYQLPILSDVAYQRIHIETGEGSSLSQAPFQHKGSFCDTVSVVIRGSTLRVSGNPSRWGRLDNLFGLTSIDACVSVYNGILSDLGLPPFTRNTRIDHIQAPDGKRAQAVGDGASVRELHITTNRAVGQGNVDAYISGLSTLRYRHSIPRLHSNGKSCDWLSKTGKAHLIYPTVYNKSHEMSLHAAPKILRAFGEHSDEYRYIQQLITFCEQSGVVRFEQKLKSRYLQRCNLIHWGLSDYSALSQLQTEFINIDQRLQVTAMDFETISQQLLSNGIVDTTRAANTTAMYAIQWYHGHVFDLKKRAVETHRARLRKIGIDIAQACNVAKFSPVKVVATREVTPHDCVMPAWYRKPNHLRAA